MRWHKQRGKPNNGDVRVKQSFLWFPRCINHECRWLEMANWKQEADTWNTWDGYTFSDWLDVEWINE